MLTLNRIRSTKLQVGIFIVALITVIQGVRVLSLAKPEKLDFAQIDSYVSDLMVTYQIPGAALALVQNGQIVYARGFGVRSVESQSPVTADTLFAIGSISKSFTSLAIAQLAAAGKLKLDDPVVKFLPVFKLADEQATQHITIRELLDQTSGVPRVDDLWLPGAPASRAQIIADLAKVEPTARPGKRFQYSNQNYVVLGSLIESMTGQTWEDYVQQHILKPLGMDADFDLSVMRKAADYAMPHVLDDRYGLMPIWLSTVDLKWLHAHGPAVSINASVMDMARYAAFQLGNGASGDQQIVSQAMFEEMHRPEAVLTPINSLLNDQGYGMAWFTENYRNYALVEHSGDVKGYAANITLVPAEKAGIVLLTNIQGSEAFRQAVRLRMVEFLLGLPSERDIRDTLDTTSKADLADLKTQFETARTFKLDPTVLRQIPGDYDGLFGQVSIELRGGRLFARRKGWLVVYELAPIADNKMLYSSGTLSGSLVLTFKIDAHGQVRFFQDGIEVVHSVKVNR